VKVLNMLVLTAWLVGAQAVCAQAPTGDKAKDPGPDKKATPVAPVTVYSDGGGCCNSCNSCCDSGGFLSRCREFCSGLFRHDDCGCGCAPTCSRPTCCAPAPTCCQPSCAPRGCTGWLGGCGSSNSCGCDSGCGFWSRCSSFCSSLFHRHDCGCDSCGCGSGVITSPKGETIPPPGKDDPAKKMPGGKEALYINPGTPTPVPAPALDTAPTAPAIAPARPGDDRPF